MAAATLILHSGGRRGDLYSWIVGSRGRVGVGLSPESPPVAALVGRQSSARRFSCNSHSGAHGVTRPTANGNHELEEKTSYIVINPVRKGLTSTYAT
jgi:hypothetical protein